MAYLKTLKIQYLIVEGELDYKILKFLPEEDWDGAFDLLTTLKISDYTLRLNRIADDFSFIDVNLLQNILNVLSSRGKQERFVALLVKHSRPNTWREIDLWKMVSVGFAVKDFIPTDFAMFFWVYPLLVPHIIYQLICKCKNPEDLPKTIKQPLDKYWNTLLENSAVNKEETIIPLHIISLKALEEVFVSYLMKKPEACGFTFSPEAGLRGQIKAFKEVYLETLQKLLKSDPNNKYVDQVKSSQLLKYSRRTGKSDEGADSYKKAAALIDGARSEAKIDASVEVKAPAPIPTEHPKRPK